MTLRTSFAALAGLLALWVAPAAALAQEPPHRVPPMPPRMAPRMAPPAPQITGTRADVAMDVAQGMPVVLVTVNGGKTLRFGIDTGAQGYGRIAPQVASDLGLVKVGEVLAGDPSGKNPQSLPIYELGSLAIGPGLVFKQVTVELLPMRDDKVDGILGIGLFKELLLTLDYASKRLVAEPGALPPADGKTVLNYLPGRGDSVQVPVRIGAVQTVLGLDTGAAQVGIALPPDKLAQIATRGEARVVGHARTVSQAFDVYAKALAVPVTVGAVTLPVTQVTYPSPDPVGVIGSLALRSAAVSIDQKNKRLRISPSAP